MEGHKLNLRNLCRICGSKIILKYGYKSAKTVEEYNDVLYQLYDIDVDMETDERYPKYLCGNCKRKLDRLKNLRESKAGCSKDYKAATFLPHSFENCMVCLITIFTSLNSANTASAVSGILVLSLSCDNNASQSLFSLFPGLS